MSSVPISNPPADLTMNDMLAYSSAFGGPAKSCRYVVRIIPQGSLLVGLGYNNFTQQLTYLVEAAEMPGRGFMMVEPRYYGPTFKLPVQTMYEDTTMSFLCRTQSFERQFFDDWMEIINPTNLWEFNYKDQYRAEIQVYQLADYGQRKADPNDIKPNATVAPTAPLATYQWTIHEAYPSVVAPQPVTWADDNFQRLSITFTYTKWTRKGRDMQAGTYKLVNGASIEGGPGSNPAPPLPGTGSLGGGSSGGGFGGGGGGGWQ
jgi:hypothetical protein